jgi:hypothetical protein
MKACDNCRTPDMPYGTCHTCGRKWGSCAEAEERTMKRVTPLWSIESAAKAHRAGRGVAVIPPVDILNLCELIRILNRAWSIEGCGMTSLVDWDRFQELRDWAGLEDDND